MYAGTLQDTEPPPVLSPQPVDSHPLPAVGSPAPALTFGKVEMGVALIISLVVLGLHLWFQEQAGGLWRDEANSVRLATLPTFGEVWQNLQFDSFPILFLALLRGWTAIFSPGDDAALRALGLMIGLGIVAVLWFNARRLGYRWPVLSLALLGCNPMFVRYGDSVRAYGLGILTMLLAFGAVWRVVESLTLRRVLLAMAAAVLSVHALYYNSVLLFAMCVGGAGAAAYARQWKKAVCVLAVGAPAAASLLVYREAMTQPNDWNFLVHFPVTLGWLWKRLSEVTGSPAPFGVWLWSLLVIGACVLVGLQLLRRGRTSLAARAEASEIDPAALFAMISLVAGTAGYTLFLFALKYYTQPWYYIAYVAFAAMCLDVVFGRMCVNAAAPASYRWRLALLILSSAFAAVSALPATRSLDLLQTNADIAATCITRRAVPGDLIVHTEWAKRIPFERYYEGMVDEVSLPPISDYRFHRYDLVLQQLMLPDPIAPVLERVGKTLRAGHRVWIVGGLISPSPSDTPPVFVPFRKVGGAWTQGCSYEFLQMQLAYYLTQHILEGHKVRLNMTQPVSEFENIEVRYVAGWREGEHR